MANVSFHLGTSTPSTSKLTAGGIYVNSSTGGIWYAPSATTLVPLGFDGPITTAGTGAAYTATVGHILSLRPGASFVMKPHATATTTSPTLNVNSLGAKTIKRRLSNGTATTAALHANSNIYLNKPVRVTYDGTYWILEDLVKPVAADLYGTISNSQLAEGISGSKISNPWNYIYTPLQDCPDIPDNASELLVAAVFYGSYLNKYQNTSGDRTKVASGDSVQSTSMYALLRMTRVEDLVTGVVNEGYNKTQWLSGTHYATYVNDYNLYNFIGTGCLKDSHPSTVGQFSPFALHLNPATGQYRMQGTVIKISESNAGDTNSSVSYYDFNESTRSLMDAPSSSAGIMVLAYRY